MKAASISAPSRPTGGWGTFGGANMELDAIGGYKHSFGSATIDTGVTWYTYPGGFSESDVVEFFGRLSGAAGPATLTAAPITRPSRPRSAISPTRRTAAASARTMST